MKYLFLALAFTISCIMEAQNIKLLSQEDFIRGNENTEVELYTIKNSNGCVAQFTNYGARWISFWCKDKNGNWGDVVLGFDNLKGYKTAAEGYHGATVGRVCGRIDKGLFTLDNIQYKLANNDGFGEPVRNHLHGGINGFHKKIWKGKTDIDNHGNEYVEFKCFSPDGEEGYPGNLDVTVRYTIEEDNTLRIDYWAKSDKRTLVNLTNHAFFNMSGNPSVSVNNHILSINADEYIECNKYLIPTGNIKSLKGTPIDYSLPIYIGENFSKDFPEIVKDKGIAIAYVLKKSSLSNEFLNFAAKVKDPKSGRTLSIYTNQPSLQVYNAWLMDGSDKGKNNIPYDCSAGIAIESQGFPDAPNHKNFPSVVINRDEVYHHITEYKFNIE